MTSLLGQILYTWLVDPFEKSAYSYRLLCKPGNWKSAVRRAKANVKMQQFYDAFHKDEMSWKRKGQRDIQLQ